MTTLIKSSDATRLRQLTPFPSLSLKIEVKLSASTISLGPQASWPEQIKALKQALNQHPTDLERRFLLAQLLSASDSSEAPEQLEIVIKEASRGLKTSPNNIEYLLKLGTCHQKQERPTVAKPFFRRITQLAPQDWRGWLALGNLLTVQMFFGGELSKTQVAKVQAVISAPSPARLQDLAQAFLAEKLSPQQVERIRGLGTEAALCFDKAIKLAPELPEAYLGRAINNCVNSNRLWEYIAKPTAGYQLFIPTIAVDLRKARLLFGEAYDQVTALALIEFLTLLQTSYPKISSEAISAEDFASLAPEAKEPIVQTTAQLNQLLKSNNREQRKGALESLALLSFFRGDNSAVEGHLSQAQEYGLLTKNSTALLLMQYFQAKRYSEAATFLRKTTETNPTLENRRILIRLFDKWEKVAERNELLETTQKDYPDDTFCLLGQSARWLQEGKPQKAAPYLKSLDSKFKNAFMSGEEKQQRDVLQAVALALGTKPTEAKALLKRVLEQDSQNEAARDILAVLTR